MRILFLNYEYPPLGGGAGNATKYLLQQYHEKGNMEVDLVTSAIGPSRMEDLGNGIRIFYVDIGKKDTDVLTQQTATELLQYAWHGYKQAAQLMRERHYDFIHAFFTVPCGTMARHLAKKYHVPYIVSLRGADVPGFSDRYAALYPYISHHIARVWRDAAYVIANSEHLRNLAHHTAKEQKIGIIPNGVNTEIFSPGAPLVKHDNTIALLVAARQMRRKGIRYAIDAVALLRDKMPHAECRLIIAGGNGDATTELHERVVLKNVQDRVLFVGHLKQDELIAAYRTADIFVFPSRNEGMSNNMLEALACGLPIIMTHTGGSEILQDGVNALFVDHDDAEGIANAVMRLIEDPTNMQKMRTANRALAETLSWESVAEKYEELYYDLFDQHTERFDDGDEDDDL